MAEQPRSPVPDFYTILGITTTSSIKEICKAYKSLVKQWSPDKNPSNKKEAQEQFAAINEAYDKNVFQAIDGAFHIEKPLSISEPTTTPSGFDHHKSVDDSFFSRTSFVSTNMSRRCQTPNSRSSTSNNDRRRCKTPTTSSQRSLSTTLSRSQSRRSASETYIPTDSSSLSRNTSRRTSTTPIVFSQSTAKKKPQPVEMKLECTLEELLEGCVKKIKITRDVFTDFGIMVQEEEMLRINVKPGWKKGMKITFEGKGDEKPGYLPADIIFSIDEKRHLLYEREGDDLELGVEIPLVQALTGCAITIPLLGGDKMSLSFDDILYPGYEKVIRGQGMPSYKDPAKRGDLRIKFLVEFPVELSDKERAEAVSILQHCS
ncbi:hypothetical protein UlMin_032565 [Ulmus minor]